MVENFIGCFVVCCEERMLLGWKKKKPERGRQEMPPRIRERSILELLTCHVFCLHMATYPVFSSAPRNILGI